MSSYLRARSLSTVGIAAIAALVVGGVSALPAQADSNEIKPSVPTSLAAAAEVATDQLIVGIKEKAGPAAAAASEAANKATAKTGVPASRVRQTASGAQVVKTDHALAAGDLEGFLAALRADPDVAYAEPDAIMQPASVDPDDGLYSLQWDLWEDRAGLRAPGAWAVNRGEGVVVAVVDTGILGHSELNPNVLPGYDMLSSASAARDGDGRDADPTDEGDWVSAGQCDGSNPSGISSWHGTHVAGTIAAVDNNGSGITGVAPEAKILPMRAMGPCGGYTSDIADSIVWAAGGVVTGAPVNPNPARVINLSLGGITACSATYQNAINFAYNSGAAVVVAAGNSNRPAVDSSPANCQNVITVAASGRSGARAPYSNYGSVVDVTAPGGDMSVGIYDGILSTSNFGTTAPADEAYEFMQGTSMAAPHVAGVAALMMSELGRITTPKNVEDRLKETARPLAYTCWLGCGSGLVDATAALDFVVGEIPVAKMSPVAATFKDIDGAANDTYTVPESEGFQYLVDDKVIAAGTYPGSGTVTVVAQILPGYTLADGVVTQWTHTFDGTTAPVDVSGPVVASSSVSPTSFNLADGPAVVKISLRLTDQTGADAPVVNVVHDGSGQTQGFGQLELVSGDTKDGVWERTVTIPQSAATGKWRVLLYGLSDTLGNRSSGPDPLGVLEVSGPPSDVTGPVVVSSSVSPTSFNLADGPAVVKISLRLTDQTGADAPVVNVVHDGSGQTQGFGQLELVSGDTKDGVWERTVTIPQSAATGKWRVLLYGLSDTLGNRSSGPDPLGVLEVSGPPSDVAGPVVVSSSVSPTSFNLADGPAVVKISLRLTDQTGADAPVVNVVHDGSGQTQGFGQLELVSGDTKDGVWERTVTIPQSAATGKWRVLLYGLSDTLGNRSSGPDPLGVIEVSAPPISVTPAAVLFTDEDGTASDTYAVPVSEGVEYLVGENVVSAGTHAALGNVTVQARAKANYVLAAGAVAEWSHTFKATPYVVTPAAVTFSDEDGTAKDTYTVPAMDGLEYLVGDRTVAAGTYPGVGTMRVTARAKANYVLAAGAVAEWSHTFKATPYTVTPAAVTFSDEDGTAKDTYTVPAADGVEYLVGGKVVGAGSYPGSGTVTVTARAKTDYVLAQGATAEWSTTFKATPYVVTPAAVTFTDKDGTAEDTFTVPAMDGVEYSVGGKVVAAGTHPGLGTVTVTARAKPDYVLAQGATAEWSTTFKATPYVVTPAAVTFTDKDGTAEDAFTVPAMDGVEYLVGGKVVAAASYPGSGTVTVTARVKTDYVLAEGATAAWSHAFKATPYTVTPAAVVFADRDGTAEDTYTVPATDGVEYLAGGKVVAAGSYAGSGTVTVTARAKTDYVLAPGATAQWTATFKATPYPVTPAAVVFADRDGTAEDSFTVPATEGVEYLVGGKVTAAGTYPGSGTVTVVARAKADYVLAQGAAAEWSITFQSKVADYVPPAVSPFRDVSTGQQFYKEMAWLADRKISTGWTEADGSRTYRALQPISRDAMAAFLYRMAGSPAYTAPAVSPFADVLTGQQFYKEMAWLAEQKISTGWTEADGSRTYRPLQPISRDAMAAFLYRMAGSPAYTAPAVSPFADVVTGQQFYKEMSWLSKSNISTGWTEGDGSRTYRPLLPISRDAMAAFLFRLNNLMS